MLSTTTGHITVMYNGLTVAMHAVGADVLRTDDMPRSVDVSYDALSPRGLRVVYNDVVYIDGVLLTEWSILPSWSFGFAARTGTDRKDNHWIDDVLIRSGAYLVGTGAAVEVASNGQQFSTNGTQLKYKALSKAGSEFTISTFFPERGPIAGGTLVTIYGFGLAGGSDYKCRFGESIAAATHDLVLDALQCTSVKRADDEPIQPHRYPLLRSRSRAPSYLRPQA